MPLPVNRCDRLSYTALFGLFPAHVRQNLIEKAETRLLKPGEVIFRKDDDGPWLAAILAGRVRIARTLDDAPAEKSGELLIAFVERDQIFGERAFYDGLPRSADAVAVEDTAIQIFKRDDLLPALYAYPDTLMLIIRTMCNRIFRYVNTMELYALCNLEVRLANHLLLLGQKYGRDTPEGRLIDAPFNQSDLAHQIASSRESVNRQLKSFAAKGYIHLDGNTLTLVDLNGLATACATCEKESPSLIQPV
jgi:CRP-like cAMP-binding protein